VLQAKSAGSKSSLKSGGRISVGDLKCSFNNPKNLAVTDLIANDQVLSFTGEFEYHTYIFNNSEFFLFSTILKRNIVDLL